MTGPTVADLERKIAIQDAIIEHLTTENTELVQINAELADVIRQTATAVSDG